MLGWREKDGFLQLGSLPRLLFLAIQCREDSELESVGADANSLTQNASDSGRWGKAVRRGKGSLAGSQKGKGGRAAGQGSKGMDAMLLGLLLGRLGSLSAGASPGDEVRGLF